MMHRVLPSFMIRIIIIRLGPNFNRDTIRLNASPFLLSAIYRCEGVDSLMAYVHIDRKKEKIDSFCGEKPARPIMSNGPRLSLEFNGITSSRQSPGFKAVYTFTESEYGHAHFYFLSPPFSRSPIKPHRGSYH